MMLVAVVFENLEEKVVAMFGNDEGVEGGFGKYLL
jgi:hypothetical protein